MDSLTFLQRSSKWEPRPVYVLHGDEDFLKRQVLAALRERVLGGDANAFGLSTHEGDKADFASIRSELETLPFLSPRRLVVVDKADPFVTRHRAALEKYVGNQASAGVLVLDVTSWPANTKLAKALPGDATITCKALPVQRLPEWCIRRAESAYAKQLLATAAKLLVDLVGAEMGQLDQELAKLAVYAGDAKRIEAEDVDKLVGHSRAENVWIIFDAISNGRSAEALTILDRLFQQGEAPLGLLGAFGSQLRPLAQAYRLTEQGVPLPAALERAGVPPFRLRSAEQQLRHLGGRRAERLFDWLLEADLGMKGSSQLPERTQLERLVVQLARA
ncbi:MAG TPA: DNA polymerase III subunit delta [Gemmataceae bacterium]|nr:DNA polymerase III subunit delta [Gemmataceae bacterium]